MPLSRDDTSPASVALAVDKCLRELVYTPVADAQSVIDLNARAAELKPAIFAKLVAKSAGKSPNALRKLVDTALKMQKAN